MANLPGPLRLPAVNTKPKKKKIDIPYNRWPNRLRRAIKTVITLVIIVSILWLIISLATVDEVSINIALSILQGIGQILLTVVVAGFGIVMQFGLLFWFLSRPKVEIIRPGDDTTVTFDDYWGQPQLVKLVKQWMSLLRDRKDFEKMGGKYISGLLLYGPPGTGKTMLAKAIAGESGMAFISAAGTSFQGMFWGMDILMVLRYAATARALARKYGACVAYIDEIDAIGMNRGGVRGGSPGMASATGMGMGLGMFALSTLLGQMDGMNNPTRGEKFTRRIYKLFGKSYNPNRNWHVMWMGSTNRPDVLDPALTRSGRLDTKIAVEPPDRASRRLVIEGYLSKVKHDDSIDVESIVADTNGLTPADISAAITKDAVRLAFFAGRKLICQKDIDKAFLEQQSGMETPVEEMDENQQRVLAYHEAGHAVAQYYVMPDQKIVRVTIVKLSTGSQGHMAPVDTVEQHVRPIMNYAYEIIVAMAGRGSEKVLTGEMYDSVGGDYPMVRMLMWRLVESGFFGPPLALSGTSYDQYREKTLEKYWLTMEDATEKLLRQHWKEVTALAEELLIRNTLSGKEVVEIIEANQTPEALQGNIIPHTLAAIRAQALAEVRSGYSGGVRQALNEPAQIASNNGKTPARYQDDEEQHDDSSDEEVIVINGNGNGAGRNGNGAHHPEPEMIGDGVGGYEPRLADEDEKPRAEPELINKAQPHDRQQK
ncbi:MAG: AAA family ATPase [Chloroflexi bacterium]|nr:AAA family ATPase [Chloroflexota bacterium]MCL5275139.1 AAA family ATPase [Chloroflexota bacterium]